MRTLNSFILAGTALLVCALYLATPVYKTQVIGDSAGAIQHNRFTGSTYLLHNRSWEKIEYSEGQPDPETSEKLPDSIKSSVTGWGGLEGDAEEENQLPFSGSLYNGTLWRLTGLEIGLMALDAEKDTVWARNYVDNLDVRPVSTGDFGFQVLTGEKFETLDWFILDVWGERRERFQDIEW